MFAREKNRLQTMNTGQRNTKLEKNVGFLMIFAKNSGLNEKNLRKICKFHRKALNLHRPLVYTIVLARIKP